jgi:hypothetical protein
VLLLAFIAAELNFGVDSSTADVIVFIFTGGDGSDGIASNGTSLTEGGALEME